MNARGSLSGHLSRHPAMKKLAVVMVAGGLFLPVPIAASEVAESKNSPRAVVEWSTQAQRAIVGRAGKSPGDAAVFMGIVHAAIYDAVVAIEGGARAYAIKPTVPAGASSEAATAAAAHGVLVGMFPGQQPILDTNYDAYLSTLADGPGKADGVAVGREVAEKMLALRADDGRDAVVLYVQPPPGPGVFEPTAPFPPIGIHLGQVRPLTLPHSRLFHPPGPPALSSDRYASDVNEVASRGGALPAHSPEERSIVRLWVDHGIPQWNRTLFRLVNERNLNIVQAARLMVMAHAAAQTP